jgi:quercetin 2,3-dioxygenase
MLRTGGRLHGVQLWVNLPRADKWVAPRYQDLRGDQLVLLRNREGTALVRLIAGELAGHTGPGDTHTPIVYAHATLQPGARLALDWPREHNALVYVLSGEGRVGGEGGTTVPATHAAALGAGDTVVVDATGAGEPLEVLLLGGRPLREPVVSYGPFVMSTKQEIIETIEEYNRDPAGFGRSARRP